MHVHIDNGGYTRGQIWGAVRKAWTDFRIAKARNDTEKDEKVRREVSPFMAERNSSTFRLHLRSRTAGKPKDFSHLVLSVW